MKKAIAAAVTAVAGLVFLAGGTAAADSGQLTGTPSAADLQHAHTAAATPQLLARLAVLKFPDSRSETQGQASIGEKTIPVYAITPEFARGEAGAPVGRLSYVAIPARTGDGTPATVAMTNDGGWRLSEIASGTPEEQVAAQLGADASLLYEPQIDGWYELRGDQVRLLDTSAAAETAPRVYSLADYQTLLVSRYADKQAGSDYDRQGLAGGYGPERPHGLAPMGMAAVAVALAGASLAGARLLRRARPA
ncbi:hypothetical protein [Nonomuraea bangladeshensis]|uniref:hypothetical protein n=1 Tax=Nonomuraea bangladeshensis TaxID=404385 RepID=UPI003C2D10CF